jgi:DNA repair protein RadC
MEAGILAMPLNSNGRGARPVKGIQFWTENERPRERLLRQGPEALSEAQLIAILLRTGRKDSTAVAVAVDLLKRTDGVQGLVNRGIAELCDVPGIGSAKAAQLVAALELGRRTSAHPLSTGRRVGSSQDIYRHYQPLMRTLRRECFKAILLDSKHSIIKDVTISEGSLSSSIVHPREAFNAAVRESAAAVVFLHNHPSGDPEPSPEDHALTRRLLTSGEILGIKVLDHLIIGDGRYVSFADQGWLVRPEDPA